jgi:hypothetical protein
MHPLPRAYREAAKPLIADSCIPVDLPPELLSLIILELETVDIVCLALTCHRMKTAVQNITGKSLREICPKKEEIKVYFRPFHKHCLNDPFKGSVHVSVEFEDLMARLRLWFGIRWLYCYACHRYRSLTACRCEMCDLAHQDGLYWRRFFQRTNYFSSQPQA